MTSFSDGEREIPGLDPRYSRLYAGGHYPSDVAAGEYLGDLISEYELRFPPATKKS